MSVNQETFFHDFATFADASNGVQKLRELILQLAVQGKLVPQDPNDEPASVLLAKIKAKKERLIQEKKIKKSEPLPPIETDEKPPGWEVIRLGEIIELISGQHIEASEYDESGKGFAYLTGPADFGSVNPVITKWTRKPKVMACAQDILITVKGAGVGKLNILHCDDVTIGRQLMAIRCPLVSNRFIFYFLSSHLSHFQSESTGTTVPGLSREDIQRLMMGLPPLAEQRRIVAKVDQLMALCDELEARQKRQQSVCVKLNNAVLEGLLTARTPTEFAEHWQRICDNFDLLYDAPETVASLRQAILQLAVQGKLAPQDPNDEPTAVLLSAIAAERERILNGKKSKNGRSLRVVDKQEFPFDAPSTWRFCRFGELAEIISGVTKGRNLTGKETASFPYLRVANVQRGFLELGVMKEIEIPSYELEKYRLIRNDIVITEGGDWDKVGRAAIWNEQIADCIHQNHVFRVRLYIPAILPKWIILFVNSPLGRRYFEAASKQTTNLASINMGQLRHCPIPLPPLAEQRRIVAKVDQLMALCDELEAKLRQAQAHSAKLMTATVQHLAAG